ncbi:MAG: sigma-70 family RNA polymerase sigma factor [Bacteroidetes bacterium]|nr:sigma-70 family RNA polymerase sigma factor [Bacteroidota bacterium]
MTSVHNYFQVLSVNDNEILNAYRQTGDLALIGQLYKRYSHLVFFVCIKYLIREEDAKDGVMQIFEKLIVDLRKHEIENFRGWLREVAKNHCLMQLRGNKKFVEIPRAAHEDEDDDVRTVVDFPFRVHPDGAQEKEKQLQKLEAAVKELNNEQRICIDLFYLQEKSYDEICALTGFTYMKVKSFIQNGKRNLLLMMTGKKKVSGQEGIKTGGKEGMKT